MKNILIFAFTLVYSLSVYSQKSDSSKVVVYEPFKSTESYDSEDVAAEYKNCLKWNMSLVGRGIFLINYERPLIDKLTIEAGIGLTYRDYIFELIRDEITYTPYGDDNITVETGLAFELGPKFYPNGYSNFDGVYFQPLYRYRSYKVFTDNDYDIGYKSTDASFIFGYQYESWNWDITWDLYFGIAMCKTNYKAYEDDDYSYSYTGKIIDETAKRPILLCGFKIGVPF